MKKQQHLNTLVHAGGLLRKYVKEKRINQAGWARKQNVHANTIATYLKSADIWVGTLVTISQTLNHNFLMDIAHMLPPEMPHKLNTDDEKLTALQKENEDLKKENILLKGLMGK